MDWAKAVDRNQSALQAIVAALFAMLGLAEGAAAGRIPKELRLAVLRVLRPAESAVRRLIVMAARDVVMKPGLPRPKPAGKIAKTGKGGGRPPVFKLEDTRPSMLPPVRRGRYARFGPRVHAYPYDTLVASMQARAAARARPPDDGLIDATRLGRRLHAIKLALADLPKQARRLARWRARRQRIATTRLIYTSPLRPNPARGRHDDGHGVEEVLRECHELAVEAMRLDSS
jgi:hypothetical protein